MIDFASIIGTINTYVWYVAFVFLVGLGIYFMIRLKGLPILRIHKTSRLALSGTKEGKHSHTVSSFEAFCIGLGARVGVGNIAGVASAIIVGGPGAVFWMWIFAIIGSASSFMESTLSQLFKEKKSDGQYHSGPAYYALKGVGSRPLAVLLAVLIIITFGIGFVGVQATNSAAALAGAFEFENNMLIFGAIIAIIGVVVCPITSGDTAFRSLRLVIADALHYNQKPIRNRLIVAVPIFALAYFCNSMDFSTIWKYVGIGNQTLAVVTLWAASAYLVGKGKPHWMMSIPATFLTVVCATYYLIAPYKDGGFSIAPEISYPVGLLIGFGLLAFFLWKSRKTTAERDTLR